MEIQKPIRKLSTIDLTLFWKLLDTQIVPILTYSSSIWGLQNVDRIEMQHTFAIKRIVNVPSHSSSKLVYGETGIQLRHIFASGYT